jgi:hypothetical protein
MAEEIIPTILRCIKSLFLRILRRLIFRNKLAGEWTAECGPRQESPVGFLGAEMFLRDDRTGENG